MDRTSLRRLAEEGLGVFPPAQLDDLAEWRREYCWATGQVAYCVLSDLFAGLFTLWTRPVPASAEEAMSAVLRRHLPAILEGDPEEARVLAQTLREEVLLIIPS